MNKGRITLAATLGGAVGSYIPVWLFNADGFSVISVLGGTIGGLLGIWAAVKLASYY